MAAKQAAEKASIKIWQDLARFETPQRRMLTLSIP
jgi:hypothetical protein